VDVQKLNYCLEVVLSDFYQEFFKIYNVLQDRLDKLLPNIGNYDKVCFKGIIDKKNGKVLSCEIEERNQQNVAKKSSRNDAATIDITGD
jgi:hypothetical protein